MSVIVKNEILNDSSVVTVIDEILSEYHLPDLNGKKVFIKPNLSGRPPITSGENTSVQVLDAIIYTLKSRYNCEIIIGHYPLLYSNNSLFTFDRMMEESGYDLLSKKYSGVKLLNLANEKQIKMIARDLTVFSPDILSKMDYFINVPKAKTHMITSVSLGIKNLMGLIDGQSRKNFHKFFLNELVGYLPTLFPPNLTIIDGLISMEGNGPHEGKDKRTRFIAAGDDIVELDATISKLIGFDYTKIEHIRVAEELGAGKFPLKEVLEKNEGKILVFDKPNNNIRIGRKIVFWPTTSCSLCHEVMREFKKKLVGKPKLGFQILYYAFFSRKRINIIIGRSEYLEYFVDDINLCIGVCTKWFAEQNGLDYLPGCPPSIDDVTDYILKKAK